MVQAIDALNNLVREEMPQKKRRSSVGSRILSAMLKTKTTRQHEAYQKFHKGEITSKRKPLSFGMWKKMKAAGGSRQTQMQLKTLGESDAAAIYERFLKPKSK